MVQSVKAINLVINVKQCSLFTTDVRQLKQMTRGKQLQATMKGEIALNLAEAQLDLDFRQNLVKWQRQQVRIKVQGDQKEQRFFQYF